MPNPAVSVVMSVYNAEKFIGEAVSSILGQTLTDIELIIINDGSTDGTGNVLKTFNDPRMRVEWQENQGLIRSLNKGIAVARGEYVARHDADDISLPYRLERQLAFLEEHKNCAMVGSAVSQIDEGGRDIKVERFPLSDEEIKKILWKDVPFAHPSVMYRKEAVIRAGLYREKLDHIEDYDLWFRMAELFELANIGEPLYKMRKHINSISLSKRFEAIRLGEFVKRLAFERKKDGKDRLDSMSRSEIEEELERIMPGTRRNRSRVEASGHLFIAEAAYCTGNYSGSIYHLWQTLRMGHFPARAWILAAKVPIKFMLGFLRKDRRGGTDV